MVPVSVWRCQQACPGRAVAAPVGASLIPTTGVTSVGTGATTPMTATASAREDVGAGPQNLKLPEWLKVETDEDTDWSLNTNLPHWTNSYCNTLCALYTLSLVALMQTVPHLEQVKQRCYFFAGLALVPALVPGPGPVDAATALAPAVVATVGMSEPHTSCGREVLSCSVLTQHFEHLFSPNVGAGQLSFSDKHIHLSS